MKSAILILFVCLANAHSSPSKIVCQTINQEKSFAITQHGISFLKQEQTKNSFQVRSVASVRNVKARYSPNGLTKLWRHEGFDYKLKIKDYRDMNELEDFLKITNSKGHTITYPVRCSMF